MDHEIPGKSTVAATSTADETKSSNKYTKWFHEKIDFFLDKWSTNKWEANVDLSVFGEQLGLRFILTDENDLFESSKTVKDTETSESAVSLDVIRNVTAEISNFSDELESLMYFGSEFEDEIEWNIRDVDFQFSLIRLKFYSADNNLAFTKYLHLDQSNNIADCGCDLDCVFSNGICSEYENGEEYHFMKVITTFDTFSTSREIRNLEQSCKAIRVVADFMFGQECHGKDSENEKNAVAEGIISTMHRRQQMLNDSTRKPDVIFRLTSGETVMAHQEVLLEGRSEMLKSMIESDMKEAKSGEINVSDESFTLSIFQDFLNGVYGGWTEREMELNCNDFQLLFSRFKICDYYLAPELLDVNVGMIIGNPHSAFSSSSALEMYEMGCIYKIPCLKTRCLQWLEYKEELHKEDKDRKVLDALKAEVEELARTLEDRSNWIPLMKFL